VVFCRQGYRITKCVAVTGDWDTEIFEQLVGRPAHRPEVILTFLPGTFIGEDHGTNQTSGVLGRGFDWGDRPLSKTGAGPTALEPLLRYLPCSQRDLFFRTRIAKIFLRQRSGDIVRRFHQEAPYWRMRSIVSSHQTQEGRFSKAGANGLRTNRKWPLPMGLVGCAAFVLENHGWRHVPVTFSMASPGSDFLPRQRFSEPANRNYRGARALTISTDGFSAGYGS